MIKGTRALNPKQTQKKFAEIKNNDTEHANSIGKRGIFMARKKSIETINKELDRLENREKSLQTDIDSVKSEKEKLLGERNEILEMERRETVDKIAEIVYEYFGENISPDKFKETVEYIFAIDEIKEFIKSTDEKIKPVSSENNSAEIIEKEAC